MVGWIRPTRALNPLNKKSKEYNPAFLSQLPTKYPDILNLTKSIKVQVVNETLPYYFNLFLFFIILITIITNTTILIEYVTTEK